MTWFLDLATVAFCDTVQLRKTILERHQLSHFSHCRVLEPSAAEFIAALAAGNNCRTIMQIGCGLSTIALAAAARTTGTCLVSVHTDKTKQETVWYHVKYLGLVDYVDFIVDDPTNVIPQREGVDFALFTGDPSLYISYFDLLKLKRGAIVVADNALHESTNDYIKHVRQQPGVDSSSLPVGRGIEVTKITSWDKFKSGRILYIVSTSKDAGAADTRELESTICNSCVTIQELSDNSTEASGESEGCESQPSFKLILKNIGMQAEVDGQLQTSSVIDGPCSKTPCDTDKVSRTQSTTLDSEKENRIDDKLQALLQTNLNSSANDGTHAGEMFHVSCEEIEATKTILGGFEVDQSHLLDCHVKNEEIVLEVDGTMQFTDLASMSFNILFKNHSSQTEVTIQGIDQDMLLTDISTAFNELGVSVQRANISTKDKYIDNVFYVVDGETRTLHPSRWEAIRGEILQNILKHRHSRLSIANHVEKSELSMEHGIM